MGGGSADDVSDLLHWCFRGGFSTMAWEAFKGGSTHVEPLVSCLCPDDGALRIWKNFADQKNPEMVTAWQGLSDMLPTTRGQPPASTHSKDLLSSTLCPHLQPVPVPKPFAPSVHPSFILQRLFMMRHPHLEQQTLGLTLV